MVRISENLIRKRAEHNNCELSTLEEVSLHQQDIEKLEYVDKWCRELKILYLQCNLIPKIENVGRLKKLEYLNLALNNVERVENLEGCESLKKLDLTVNHVRELTSITCLSELPYFKELYMSGNPCTDYEDYRKYVIATLPQLKILDGTNVEKSERIIAVQEYGAVKRRILEQQAVAMAKREKEKTEYARKEAAKKEAEKKKEEREKQRGEKKPGFDGRWYTDINPTVPAIEAKKKEEETEDEEEEETEDVEETEEAEERTAHGESGTGGLDLDKAQEKKVWTQEELEKQRMEEQKEKEFWDEPSEFTPESRVEVHRHLEEQRLKKEGKPEEKPKKERRLFYDNGRAYNVNEPKLQFTLEDDEENNRIKLDLAVWKHLDTSLVDADVQPQYVRVTVKGKVFQIHLDTEVSPDKASAQRSQTTGHLVITMPKAQEKISAPKKKPAVKPKETKVAKQESPAKESTTFLEVDPTAASVVDIAGIVQEKGAKAAGPVDALKPRAPVQERENSPDFVDDPDVPPLI